MGFTMKIQTILVMLLSFVVGALVYATDWQRKQDEKIADIDKLITRQSALMEMQIKYNEYMVDRRVISHSFSDNEDEPIKVQAGE